MGTRTTRLAPSPTGALHLGNARTFLINWAMATADGWRVVMRLEDLDGPRVRAGAAEDAIELLDWLRLDWDGETLVQSNDLAPYVTAMERLCAAGRSFASTLTRSEVAAAASAPHGSAHDTQFNRSLRPPEAGHPCAFVPGAHNHRVLVDDGTFEFDDLVHGHCVRSVAETVGDFVIWTRNGTPAYQLAVVVDDARQGVTDVIRGDDLLDSTARQILLCQALDLPIPRYCHLPLVLGPDGRRLAKRHGDTRVDTYRRSGVPADRIIGLLADWSGVPGPRRPMSARVFADSFRLDRLSRNPVTFTKEDHAWLLEDC